MDLKNSQYPKLIDGKILFALIILALGLDIFSTGFFVAKANQWGIPLETIIRWEENPLLSFYWRWLGNASFGLLLHFGVLTIGYTGLVSLAKYSSNPGKIRVWDKSFPFFIYHGSLFFIILGVIIAHLIVSFNNMLILGFGVFVLSGIGPQVLRVFALLAVFPILLRYWRKGPLIKIEF